MELLGIAYVTLGFAIILIPVLIAVHQRDNTKKHWSDKHHD